MTILEQMRPGFFELPEIKNMPEDWGCFEEMLLELDSWDENREIREPEGINEFAGGDIVGIKSAAVFEKYSGSYDKLLEAVAAVDKDWPKYFKPGSETYAVMVGEEIASFCMMDDMGTHEWNGKAVKIGGPGCVGTVPKFRKNGYGLYMVKRITDMLKLRGYDISYIHWTSVPDWYAKLGYKVINVWNKHGFCGKE